MNSVLFDPHLALTHNCLGPRKNSAPQRTRIPLGAWDTHAHVIGAPPDYPLVDNRHYSPPAASVDDYVTMLDVAGLSYGVLVQVSVHGFDNRLLVEALRRYPRRLCGVAVVPPDAPTAALTQLHDAGVRGLRLLALQPESFTDRSIERTAAQCRDFGWHLQLAMPCDAFPTLEAALRRIAVPLVIDHMGLCSAKDGTGSDGFKTILRLVRSNRCWVKFSGAFRLSQQRPPYEDTAAIAHALLQAAPDRVVWGSDWPHVGLYESEKRPAIGELLDLFEDWGVTAALQHQVLVDNPPRLYGVPGQ